MWLHWPASPVRIEAVNPDRVGSTKNLGWEWTLPKAIEKARNDIVADLLASGVEASPDVIFGRYGNYSDGPTPLQLATHHDNLGAAKLLIEHGA